MRQRCQKVVGRLANAELARALASWQTHTHDQVKVRAVCERIVKRWLKRQLSYALSGWSAAHVRSVKQKCIVSKICPRWKALQMLGPYAACVEHCREIKRMKRAAELVLSRWSRRGLAPAFDKWRENYAI